MKKLKKYAGPICAFFYLFSFLIISGMCQWGFNLVRLALLFVGILGFFGSFALWVVKRIKYQEEEKLSKKGVGLTIGLLVLGSLFCGLRIIYSATPYNGELFFAIHDIQRKETATIEDRLVMEEGIEKLLDQICDMTDLHGDLYIENGLNADFDEDGKITSMYIVLKGEDSLKSPAKYTVYYNDYDKELEVTEEDFDLEIEEDDIPLEPFMNILQESSIKEMLDEWEDYGSIYYGELDYTGKEILPATSNVAFIYTDPEADTITKEDLLENGGAIKGYSIRMFVHASNEMVYHYMLDPEYIDEKQYARELEKANIRNITYRNCTVHPIDKTMTYNFYDYDLGENTEWRASITEENEDGNSYRLERYDEYDGWIPVNDNIFKKDKGYLTEISFVDEYTGFVGLTDHTWKRTSIYKTTDGGENFVKISFPEMKEEDMVYTNWLGEYDLEDYKFAYVPQPIEDGLIMKIVTDPETDDGPTYYTEDGGESWEFYY